MAKIFRFISGLLFFLILLLPVNVQAQDLNDFVINSFEADYYLVKNENNVGELKVTEKITADFVNFNQNHGIERALPEKYKNHNLNLKIISIKDQTGEALNYSTRKQNDNLILKIGNADKYVNGLQTYVITYHLQDPITFFNNHDEWYWDVNGDQWKQPMRSVSANIYMPNNLASALHKTYQPICYTGVYKSTDQACHITKESSNDGTIIKISANTELSAGENLSFVIGFNKSTFTKYKLSTRQLVVKIAFLGGCLGLPALGAFLIMFSKWKKVGRDPKGKGIIVAQYSVPDEINPMLADFILHENMRTSSVSAAIVEMCIKGYLKLYEVKKDKLIGSNKEYELEVMKSTEDLSSEESQIVSAIFNGSPTVGRRVNISKLGTNLYKKITKIKSAVSQKSTDQGYFMYNPEKARNIYSVWGGLLIALGIIPFFFFRSALLFTSGFILAGIIVLIFNRYMPQKTLKGVAMKDYLLGIKEYMQLAESERIKFLQSPETAEKVSVDVNDSRQLVKLYEKLLPYAMLFGIEKQWATQFASLYKNNESPEWYSGSSTFRPQIFSNSLNSFSRAALSSFNAPTSSGASGFGGGFSGGGGGGGGGGGW